MSNLELTLETHLKIHGLPEAMREYRFAPPRRWRFDFAFVSERIAIECEGGTRNNGRHSRHEGYRADCLKYNEAIRQGWKVYRFTGDMVRDGTAINFLKEVFAEIGTMELQF